MFPLKYKQSNESNDYYHCYQLDKNNKITLKAIDVESMSKRKEAYAFLKMKYIKHIIQKKMLKKEVINQIIQISQVIDMNLKIKIIKKQADLFMEHLRLKIKSFIFSYEYTAGRDEEHESEYEYLMSDTKYENYD